MGGLQRGMHESIGGIEAWYLSRSASQLIFHWRRPDFTAEDSPIIASGGLEIVRHVTD